MKKFYVLVVLTSALLGGCSKLLNNKYHYTVYMANGTTLCAERINPQGGGLYILPENGGNWYYISSAEFTKVIQDGN
jgi:hypothetical protein